MNEHESLALQTIIERYRQLSRALKEASAPVWLELDLTMAQLKTLLVVHDQPSPTISQIAESLAVGAPTASQLVDKLVQAGLVQRADDPADRRRALARLTDEGQALVERLREGPRERLREWLSQLDASDRAALSQGLDAMCRAAGLL